MPSLAIFFSTNKTMTFSTLNICASCQSEKEDETIQVNDFIVNSVYKNYGGNLIVFKFIFGLLERERRYISSFVDLNYPFRRFFIFIFIIHSFQSALIQVI